jgi:hypothetical protein
MAVDECDGKTVSTTRRFTIVIKSTKAISQRRRTKCGNKIEPLKPFLTVFSLICAQKSTVEMESR